MSRKYKAFKKDLIAESDESTAFTVGNPFENNIADLVEIVEKSIDNSDELCMSFSNLTTNELYKNVDKVLTDRDTLLRKTLLKDFGGGFLSKGVFTRREQADDDEKVKCLSVSDSWFKDSIYAKMLLSDHISDRVFIRGKLRKWIIERRMGKYGCDVSWEGKGTAAFYTECVINDRLVDLIEKLSRAYMLAYISKQVQDYERRYGKENCQISVHVYDEPNTAYSLVLTHTEFDSVMPVKSEETVYALPADLYKVLYENGDATEHWLNFAYYDKQIDAYMEKYAFLSGLVEKAHRKPVKIGDIFDNVKTVAENIWEIIPDRVKSFLIGVLVSLGIFGFGIGLGYVFALLGVHTTHLSNAMGACALISILGGISVGGIRLLFAFMQLLFDIDWE